MFFTQAKAWQIVEGRKTVEFRATMPKNRTIGKTYQVQVAPAVKGGRPGPVLASIRLRSLRTIALGEIDDVDARRAGYMNLSSLKERWHARGYDWDPARIVYRMEFDLINTEQKAKVTA